MAYQHFNERRQKVFLSNSIHEHNRKTIKTRFKYLNVEIIEGDAQNANLTEEYAAIISSQFGINGDYISVENTFAKAKENNIICILDCDLLALSLFKSPKELNADICVGSSQRLGVAMGFGGPSAAFYHVPSIYVSYLVELLGFQKISTIINFRICKPESNTFDVKEQHQIFAAQALLAIINSFYAVYHGLMA